MKISKLKIKNLFGITEFEADGKSIELLGANGTGKTSVLDAIRLALTNKTDREFTVKNGETEGEILIEFDNGIAIQRKPRTNMTDYKKITQDGKEVQSPESFLNSLFSRLQLNPVQFIELDEKEQNRIILQLIKYEWDLNTIEKWFGEIPAGVDYSKTILEVLEQIASEDGFYYKQRTNLNRQIKDKEAVVEEMVRSIPEGVRRYTIDKWLEIEKKTQEEFKLYPLKLNFKTLEKNIGFPYGTGDIESLLRAAIFHRNGKQKDRPGLICSEYIALCSEDIQKFCNLPAWCITPAHFQNYLDSNNIKPVG